MRRLTTPERIAKYGKPNEYGSYLRKARIPFPLRLAWDPNVKVSTIACHVLEVPRVEAIFVRIFEEYGLPRIQQLGIDLYGGCFSFRKERGGDDWSSHSWATAIDLDPDHNKLKESKRTARFALPDYAPMLDAFEANGWLSLGRLRDYDWMHMEAAA